MSLTVFGKDSGRHLVRDIIIAVVCILLYAGFIFFLFIPEGTEFFGFIRGSIPFKHLVEGTLSDMDRMLGAIFQDVGLGEMVNSLETEFGLVTFDGVFIDLCKLMVCSFIQSIIFLAFSYLFLYAGKFSVASLLMGEGMAKKVDILYNVNHCLLMGISMLAGGILGNGAMELVKKALSPMTVGERTVWSLGIFLVLFILFSLYFMLKSKRASGGFFNFGRAMSVTLSFNILPEILTFFMTNIIAVFMFHSFKVLGFHWVSLLALAVFILWSWLADKIEGLFATLVIKNLPFCGKKCPISGIFWLPATLSFVAIFYIMAIYNMNPNAGPIEASLYYLPFVKEWAADASVFTNVSENVAAYKEPLLQLLAFCTVLSALQYVTSSFLATLFTQVFGRIMIILGAMLVAAVAINSIIIYVCTPLLSSIDFTYVTLFFGILLYILFACFQPHVALQGILTTALVLFLMEVIPGTMIVPTEITNAAIDMYLGAALISMGVNLLMSLLQNLVAFFEKKAYKAVSIIGK